MGQFFDTIPETVIPWIEKQEMFWVATAPLTAEGHVNVSPKGLRGSFHVIDKQTVWYEDFTGSGIETISHLRENGRITILFSAFQGAPRIVRLFGTGVVHEFGTPAYDELVPPALRRAGSRSAIVINVQKVGTSCGYAVPLYEFKRHRTTLPHWFDKVEKTERDAVEERMNKGSDGSDEDEYVRRSGAEEDVKIEGGLKWYWAKENLKSIDGLSGLASAFRANAVPTSVQLDDGVTPNLQDPGKSPTGRLVGVLDTVSYAEHIRLLFAFLLGIALAMYIKF